jgi:hypothetical protein
VNIEKNSILFCRPTSLFRKEVFGLLCFIDLLVLPAGRVLMMLGKAQFELQKFVDSYVNSFDTIVKLDHNLIFKSITVSVFFMLLTLLAYILTSVFPFVFVAYKYYKYNRKPIRVTSEGATSCGGSVSLIMLLSTSFNCEFSPTNIVFC